MSWVAPTYRDRMRAIDLGGKGQTPDRDTLYEAINRKARSRREQTEDDSGLPDDLEIPVAERVAGRPDPVCPCCGLVRPDFVLADVSGIPDEITGGAKWACDGCRTRWARTQPPLANGTRLTPSVMMAMMGAPTDHVDKVRAKEPPPPTKVRSVRARSATGQRT